MNQVTTSTPTSKAPTRDQRRGVPGGQQRPGGPQRRRRQMSRYGTQMEEKQNLKSIFGLREGQLRKYYHEAHAAAAETGPQLISLLELRLDNALYRVGFAPTRPAARQMASHRLVAVNDQPVSIPSYRLKVNDIVSVRASKHDSPLFENFEKRLQNVAVPSWLALTPKTFSFKVTALPSVEEAAVGVDVKAIVEYFAR
jgi:small subunit ribosomal protein S4